jgi:protein-tyrosine phosphatase
MGRVVQRNAGARAPAHWLSAQAQSEGSRGGHPTGGDGVTMPAVTDRHVLFVCTGNYYRSRFAEELWCAWELAEPTGVGAKSRGFLAATSSGNVGPISRHAVEGLAARGVLLGENVRPPAQIVRADLETACRVVAMNREEHRFIVRTLFPDWADRFEYWDIEDVGLLSDVPAALTRLEARVRALRMEIGAR